MPFQVVMLLMVLPSPSHSLFASLYSLTYDGNVSIYYLLPIVVDEKLEGYCVVCGILYCDVYAKGYSVVDVYLFILLQLP